MPVTHSPYVTTSYIKSPQPTSVFLVKLTNKLVFYLIFVVKFTTVQVSNSLAQEVIPSTCKKVTKFSSFERLIQKHKQYKKLHRPNNSKQCYLPVLVIMSSLAKQRGRHYV